MVAVSHFSFLIYQEDVITGSLIIRKKHGQCKQLQHQFNRTKVGKGRAEGLREVAVKRQDMFFSLRSFGKSALVQSRPMPILKTELGINPQIVHHDSQGSRVLPKTEVLPAMTFLETPNSK